MAHNGASLYCPSLFTWMLLSHSIGPTVRPKDDRPALSLPWKDYKLPLSPVHALGSPPHRALTSHQTVGNTVCSSQTASIIAKCWCFWSKKPSSSALFAVGLLTVQYQDNKNMSKTRFQPPWSPELTKVQHLSFEYSTGGGYPTVMAVVILKTSKYTKADRCDLEKCV